MTDLAKMNILINELSDEPFKYGSNDCYTFTSRLVKEWHGKDYTLLHAVYKSEKAADEYIAKHGGLRKLIMGTLGYSCSPKDCRDGDVVVAMLPLSTLGFVFQGHGLFKTKKSVRKLPLSKCEEGWRII